MKKNRGCSWEHAAFNNETLRTCLESNDNRKQMEDVSAAQTRWENPFCIEFAASPICPIKLGAVVARGGDEWEEAAWMRRKGEAGDNKRYKLCREGYLCRTNAAHVRHETGIIITITIINLSLLLSRVKKWPGNVFNSRENPLNPGFSAWIFMTFPEVTKY